jgi:lysyl-tRNA synthetase class 2
MGKHTCWRDLAGRMPLFEKRAAFLYLLRTFFRRRGFLEVDSPLLVPAAGMEPHLDAFAAKGLATGREAFLPTSPEFYLKKLLAAGVRRCYSLSPAFRDEPTSRGHSAEFLMLEWYRTEETHERLLRDCAALLAEAGRRFLPGGLIKRGKVVCDFTAGLEVLSLSMAFRRFTGRDWLELEGEGDWREAARAHGGAATDGWTPTDCFSFLMVAVVEPRLADFARPVALVGYPAFQAALARLDPQDERISERFELYAAGVELANAYTELTDPVHQRSRYEAYQAERIAQGKPPHPLDEGFMDAVGHLPPCAGIALGADRLLALLLDEPVSRVRHGCGQ